MLSGTAARFATHCPSKASFIALPRRIVSRGYKRRASSMSLEKITFGDNLPGYSGGPKEAPGIIVLQEWWGITEEIKSQASYISEKGFRVLVPDLYKGKVGVDAEEAKHLMNDLDFGQALKEIGEAAALLRKEGASKVGVVGFCMGGALSFLTAQNGIVDAAAPFYGTPPAGAQKPEQYKCPVQAHTGADDNHKGFSDPETVKALVDKINAAGGSAELFVYEGCGHGFMNKGEEIKKKMQSGGMKVNENDELRDLAWSRVVGFFKKNLA